jgi:hypothetical protein
MEFHYIWKNQRFCDKYGKTTAILHEGFINEVVASSSSEYDTSRKREVSVVKLSSPCFFFFVQHWSQIETITTTTTTTTTIVILIPVPNSICEE